MKKSNTIGYLGIGIAATAFILLFMPGIFFQGSLWDINQLLSGPLGLLGQAFDKEIADKAAEVAGWVTALEWTILIGVLMIIKGFWGDIHIVSNKGDPQVVHQPLYQVVETQSPEASHTDNSTSPTE